MNRLNEMKDTGRYWDCRISEWRRQGIYRVNGEMVDEAREDYWILRGTTCAIRYQRNSDL